MQYNKMHTLLFVYLIHTAGGLFVGTVVSLLFFKARRFPIVLGAGFGLGVAYRNCEEELNANK